MPYTMSQRCASSAGLATTSVPSLASASHCKGNKRQRSQGCTMAGQGRLQRAVQRGALALMTPTHLGQRAVPHHHTLELAAAQQIAGHGLQEGRALARGLVMRRQWAARAASWRETAARRALLAAAAVTGQQASPLP
jgi:hypothetical protein